MGTSNSASQYSAAAELEVLANNVRFSDWIAEVLSPMLAGRVLEVGAGIGTMTTRLAPSVDQLVSVEPAANLTARLEEATRACPNVTVRQGTSHSVNERGFDGVTYISVLEHIEDDRAEMGVARDLLAPGGRLGVFVPAMPALYGTMDKLSDHFRRYTREGLRDVVESGGFRIDELLYVDMASVVPYWLAYRVIKLKSLGGGSGALFDRFLIPLSRGAQRVWKRPPFGKNLVCLATRA